MHLIALFSINQIENLESILERLKPNRRIQKAITGISQWACVEQEIESGRIETPADFFHKVRTISDDTILYATLTHHNEDIRRRCDSYYRHHRHQRLSINGEALRELEIPEGPVYRLILNEVLSMRINGTIKNVEEERFAARDIWLRRNIDKI